MTQLEKQKKINAIHAMVLLQCFAHYYDESEASGVLTKRLKQQSKHLLENFEKDLKSNLIAVHGIEGGKYYEECIVVIEGLISTITKFSLDQWPAITEVINLHTKEE